MLLSPHQETIYHHNVQPHIIAPPTTQPYPPQPYSQQPYPPQPYRTVPVPQPQIVVVQQGKTV